MPKSRPPMFDDGGGLPEVARTLADEHHDDTFGTIRGPNYLVRRAIAVGVAVVAVAAVAIAAGMFIGDDGAGSSNSFANADWNRIVSVDNAFGTVVLTDKEGEETDRFRLGVQPLTDARIAGKRVVATSSTALAVVELNDTETVTTIDFEADGPLLMPSGSAQTIIARDASSQRAIFVHGPSGETIDTADADTVVGARYDVELARSDPSGRHVLVTDSGNFQSVLFSFDRDDPSFFPGLALAVNDSFVVTAQNVGTDATIAVFDHAGEPSVSGRTASVRAGMLVDGGVMLVTVDGDIVTLSLSSGEVADGASLTVGTVQSGHVAARGDRLIVVGDQGTAVINSEGVVIADLPNATPTTTGIDALAPRRSDCLIAARDSVGEVVVVELVTGNVIAEALANPEVLAGVDGCAPIVPTSAGYLVVTADGVLRATIIGDVVAVSPDGLTIISENANRLELQPRVTGDDAEAAEPLDIGRAGRTIFFADL